MTREAHLDRPRRRQFGIKRFRRGGRNDGGNPQIRSRGQRQFRGRDRPDRPRRFRGERGDRRRGGRGRRGDRQHRKTPHGPEDLEKLDKQLKNYWINQKDSSKSKEELKQIAKKKFDDTLNDKLNNKLEEYWKQKKQAAQ